MVEITDFESAKAWAETQDHQTRVWFATRCALRALPWIGFASDKTIVGLALASLRAMLISGGASTCPPPEMKGLEHAARSAGYSAADYADPAYSAAYSAYSAAESAARSADYAARSAAYSANSAADSAYSANSAADYAARSAESAAYSAANSDGQHIMTWVSLWPDQKMPDGLAEGWSKLKAFMEADLGVWGFWLEWYEAILDGRPLPWDLTFQIATTLTDEDWEAGAAHVAGRIREIQLHFLAGVFPATEKMSKSAESDLLTVSPLDLNNPELIETVVDNVSDLLEDVLASQSNAITNGSWEARVLTRTLSKYATDPQRIEMDFQSIVRSLSRQFLSGELPESEENLGLRQALQEGINAITATHPEVAANRFLLNESPEKTISQVDLDALSQVTKTLEDKFEETHAVVLKEDYADLVELTEMAKFQPEKSAYAIKDAIYRFFSRALGYSAAGVLSFSTLSGLSFLVDDFIVSARSNAFMAFQRGSNPIDGRPQNAVALGKNRDEDALRTGLSNSAPEKGKFMDSITLIGLLGSIASIVSLLSAGGQKPAREAVIAEFKKRVEDGETIESSIEDAVDDVDLQNEVDGMLGLKGLEEAVREAINSQCFPKILEIFKEPDPAEKEIKAREANTCVCINLKYYLDMNGGKWDCDYLKEKWNTHKCSK